MEATDLDKNFDAGEDITKHLDLSKARRPRQQQRRVNIVLPVWMIAWLNREAKQLSVSRQSLIKMLITRHLDETKV